MEARIYFSDGTEITAQKNADCYITNTKPEIPEELGLVIIQWGEDEEKRYEDAVLVECASVDGRYWFAFSEVSEAAKEKAAMQAEIDMLTECILEMSEIIYG